MSRARRYFTVEKKAPIDLERWARRQHNAGVVEHFPRSAIHAKKLLYGDVFAVPAAKKYGDRYI